MNKNTLISNLDDIYLQKDYIKLYLKDGDSIFEFEYKKNKNFFYIVGIKKPILQIGNNKIKADYFDLETVYGYGGIITNTNDKIFLKTAFDAYKKECYKQNIIAEFFRVHPYNDQPKELINLFDFYTFDRKTITVDTSKTTEERWLTYPSKTRNILRKCKKELTFEKSTDIDTFFQLYNDTMKKNDAEDFYFFSKEYFKTLLSLPKVELYVVKHQNTIISASFFMFSKNYGHYHLSANDYTFRKFNANYFILDSIFNVAHSKKVSLFHLGGGRTNNEDDSLLKFKSKFSSITSNFNIGGIIHNSDVYHQYNEIWQKNNPTNPNFFLKYRL